MRKRNWTAARQPGSRECGKVWHGRDEGKESPHIREKRMWLGGICLGLSVAVAACGTDGRNAGAPETTDIQSVQEGQDTEAAQDRQDARTAQGVQETEGTENVQNTSATQDLQETAGTQNEEALREQVLSEMTDEQKNWMGGLSKEQRLADFASLCEGLRENYPYVKLAKRQVGADLDALETEYRAKVEQCENDDAFFYVLKDFVGTFSYTGHLALWGRRYESELADEREYVENSGREERERKEPYLKTLDNPVSHRTYASMTKYYQEIDCRMEEKRAEENGGDRGESVEAAGETAAVEEAMPANVETKILEPGKTAYVFIDAFDYEQMETDREILLPFYEKVQSYDNLIIDITNNPGGSMSYFNKLIAAPLAEETLTVPGYQLFKDGENNRTFLRVEEKSASGLYQPISELPAMPGLNREDAADCDWFLREDYTIEPTGDGFGGKIWLLVSENNYSSSEYAAMFSKASGFATLVGRRTSGDGIGTDPAYLILPNSGLVAQYSPMYGVTADGSGSEEHGTEPDFVSPEGESALETCLGLIK